MNSRPGIEKHEPHQRREQSGSVQTQEDNVSPQDKIRSMGKGSGGCIFLASLFSDSLHTLFLSCNLIKGSQCILRERARSYFRMHQKRAPSQTLIRKPLKGVASSLDHAEVSPFTSPVVFKISRLEYRANKKWGDLESF